MCCKLVSNEDCVLVMMQQVCPAEAGELVSKLAAEWRGIVSSHCGRPTPVYD